MTELPAFANPSNPKWRWMKLPKLDGQMAWFIGMFWLSGYVDKPRRNRARLVLFIDNLDHDESGRAFQQLLRFDSGLSPMFIPYRGVDCDNLSDVLCCKSKPLSEYFVRYIKPSNGVVVPDFITRSTVENRVMFLMGLKAANGNGSTLVTSCNIDLVRPIQELARSCGLDTQLVPMGSSGASVVLSA